MTPQKLRQPQKRKQFATGIADKGLLLGNYKEHTYQ